MLKYLEKKFALTNKGAVQLLKGTLLSALLDLSFMLPIGLVVYVLTTTIEYLSKDIYHFEVPIIFYVGTGILLLFVMGVVAKAQYKSVYVSTYYESANRRIHLAEKLRRLPLSFFGKKDLSDLTNTIMSDCADLEKAFVHFEEKRKTSDLLQEGLESIHEIKSANGEKRYLDGLDEQLAIAERTQIKSNLLGALIANSAQLVLKLGLVTLVIVGTALLTKGEISPMLFFMYLIVASRIFDPVISIFEYIAHITNVNSQITRMNEIINYPIQDTARNITPTHFEIEFKDVTFGYNKTDSILKDVSFTAKQGEVTALVGPSGSGKSTVAKLAARFWDANSGTVTIGGIRVEDFDSEELLKYYSIVFQDVTLFNTSLKENIRIGKKDATDKEIMDAAHAAGCDEFIKRLPNGIDTIVGENGTTISGGERQRISIARALLKDAPIILLDEVSASLDVENETKIQEAISCLTKNKTVIIIAHRMRTISNANKIVVLEAGRVVQCGNHNELINQDGIYKQMVLLQSKK